MNWVLGKLVEWLKGSCFEHILGVILSRAKDLLGIST
jgi:hypothetical protein